MPFETMLIAGALYIIAAQVSPTAPPRPRQVDSLPQHQDESGASLRERPAHIGLDLEKTESLYDIVVGVERSFGVKISIEPLPEHCVGTSQAELAPEPFAIFEGERFGDVVARLESAAQGRWIFEEIHGVPLLRPDTAVVGHGTLLDTVISVDIEALSMWDALCALARAVNQTNGLHASGARPLLITFAEPAALRHPPAMFIEEKLISLSLKQITAREGLCAIFAQVGTNIRYLYNCVEGGRKSIFDYITISAFDDEGTVINGGRIDGEEYEHLLKTEEWMSDEGIRGAQVPVPDAGSETVSP